MHILSRAEEIVLLAIWKLQGNAYGVTIREQVYTTTGYEWSIGAIYAPLHRLEKKGLVVTVKGKPLPERGGRSRVYYEVTPEGKKALQEIKRVTTAMWLDAPDLGLEQV
jgi:DNA-binding PadR family transcriptional regulator